ncbi:MAG: hypothetical protein WBP12_00520 [Candidatus Saccharimonas sp.]
MTGVASELDAVITAKNEERREIDLRRQQALINYTKLNSGRISALETLRVWLRDNGQELADIPVSVGYDYFSGVMHVRFVLKDGKWTVHNRRTIFGWTPSISEGVYELDTLEGQFLLAQAALPWIAGWVDRKAHDLKVEAPRFSGD